MGLYVKHLQDHSTGRKSYRRQFPNELRQHLGRTQYRVSLGHPDSPGFLSRYEAAAAKYDWEVALARRKLAGAYDQLDAPTIAYLAEAFHVEQLEDDEAARWDTGERTMFKSIAADLDARGVDQHNNWLGHENARWAMKTRETLEAFLPEYVALRANGDMDGIVEMWRDEALDLAEARGLTVNPEDHTAISNLCRALNDAAISSGKDRLGRLEGADIPTPPEPERPVKGRAKASKGPAVPIMTTYDTYALASGMTVRVRNEWRTSIQRLVDHIGHDDAASLTADDLRAWRNALLQEPVRGGKLRSPVTVRNKYIRPVKAMLEWSVQEGKLATNAADKVTVTVPRTITLRQKDFTAEEAKAILAATLQPPPARMTEGHRLARRWIPWLCAYSGARVGEFAQLRAEDVKEAGGIWYCNITPDAGTVKTGEAREVPLHAHLIEQGFLDIVKAKGTGPLFYDPGQQRVANEGNRHIDKIGERLGQWVRNDVGITDKAIKPNHAWRHTFKTLAADVGIGERVADAIQGHAPNTVGGTYGTVSLKAKAAAMALFPRFEVPGSGQ